MKTTILFLLLIPIISLAQVSVPMKTDKWSDVTTAISFLIGKDYRLTKADTAVKAYKEMTFQFTNKSDESKVMFLKFWKSQENGSSFYHFRQVTGSYDELFAFWKKYVEPLADREATRDKQQTVVMCKEGQQQKRLVFFKSGNEWVITVRS